MGLRELFCFHEYEPMAYYRSFWDKEADPYDFVFVVTYRCKKCMKHKEQQVRKSNDIESYLNKRA